MRQKSMPDAQPVWAGAACLRAGHVLEAIRDLTASADERQSPRPTCEDRLLCSS